MKVELRLDIHGTQLRFPKTNSMVCYTDKVGSLFKVLELLSLMTVGGLNLLTEETTGF